MPPTWTVVVLWKPVPVTVRVRGPAPATVVVGLIELTVGPGVEVEVDEVELDEVEFDEDPPQPTRRTNARREKNAVNLERAFIRRPVY
jgi:hypothetical protein